MKKITCLIFLCVAGAAFALWPGKSVEDYEQEAIALYTEGPVNAEKILTLASEGLARFPNSVTLLNLKARFYGEQGNLDAARADVARITLLAPEWLHARAVKCFLDEILGAPPHESSLCYRTVAELYKKKFVFQPDIFAPEEYSYVLMLLMGHAPEAENSAKAFLAKVDKEVENGADARLYHELLENFDRTKVLREFDEPSK